MTFLVFMSQSNKTSYEVVLYCIMLLPLYTNFASLPDFKEIIGVAAMRQNSKNFEIDTLV